MSDPQTPTPLPTAGEPGTVAITVPGKGEPQAPSYRHEPETASPKLRVSNLHITYIDRTGRATEAVRDVSFDIADKPGIGEIVVFLGPSGCGKSTLLYLIAGLEEATDGLIWSFGDLVEMPSPERSLIFQETSLFPWLTVWQNVSFGLAIRGASQAERRRVAAEALQRVGLKAAMDKRPDELSGGMRQRVAVARALAMRPKVLLMDEPFAALDVQTRARMQDFLLDVWRDSDASVLFVTHHIDEAVALADRVVVFTARPGRIKTIVPIDLPRPRNLFSRDAEALRIKLTDLLRDEVDRAFAEQEALGATA
jgi:NitT/TauT family transport system ATP-binding protein